MNFIKCPRRSLPESIGLGINLSDGLRVGVAHGDAAHVDAALDHEEALHAPVCRPGVLDQPVVKSAVWVVAVAHSQYSVVHVHGCVATHGRGVHTAGIGAEVISDLEGHRDGLLEDGSFELDLITLSDVRSVANGEHEVSGVHSASTVLSEVRIVLLGSDSTGIVKVLKCVGWKATIASVVLEVSGTINELLLSIGLKTTILNQVGALKASDS